MSELDDLYIILRAQYAPMVEGFQATAAAGEKMATSVVAAANEITAQVERMAVAVRTELGVFDEATNKAAYDMDRLAKQTTAASLEMEAAMGRAAAANEKVGASMAASSGKFAAFKGAVTAGAIGFDLIAGASVKMAADFESSTTRLVTSAGEIHQNLDMVRQGILDMAGQVGDSAEALSKALYTIESGGQHGADGLKVLRAAAEGAKTENADLGTVADAVTSILQDYHLKADDAATVTSKLVAATGAGKTTFQELAGSMSAVMPKASAAHIALSDILGDLASMTVHGMSAQQAAQNLADAISHMQNPTAIQAKELALLGMTTTQLAGDLQSKGLSGTLLEISDRIRKLAPPGTDKVILNLRTALNGLSPAVRQLGVHLFDGTMSAKEYTKAAQALDPISAKQALSFATLAGTTHRIGDQQLSGAQIMQNYGQALAKATGDSTSLNVALMLTGDNAGTTADAIKAISGASTEAGNHVKGWRDIQGTFNQKLAEAKASLGALAIEVGEKLLPAASKMLGWLSSAAGWLSKYPALATALAVAIGVLAVAFTVATVAMWAMSTTPVFWVIAAIVAAVVLLVFAIYELVTHWHTVWGAIWGLMKAIGHWFAHDFADFFIQVWKHIWNDFLQPVGHFFEAVFNAVKGFLLGVGHWFAHDFVDFFVGMWHGIVKVWDAIIGFFRKWWPLLLVIFAPEIALLLAIWNHFHTQIIGGAKAAWSWILGFLKGAWNDIKNFGVAVWHGIYDAVVNPIEKLVHWLHEQWEIIKLATGLAWNWIKDKTVAVWHAIYDAIIKPVEDAWHAITAKFDQIKQTVTSKFDEAWHAVQHVGDKFADVGEGIVKGIMHGISNGWHWLTDQVGNLANDALKAAKSFLGISSPSKVMADQVGRWIPHGIAVGIQDAAGVAHNAMGRLTAGLLGQPNAAASIGLRVAPAAVASATMAAMSAASTTGGAAGGMQPVVVNIDGKKVFDAMVPYAQRRGIRNSGNTFLTRTA